MKTRVRELSPVLVYVVTPFLAAIVMSGIVFIESDVSWGLIGLVFLGLILVAFRVTDPPLMLHTVLLASYYCGTSLFFGLLFAFVQRVLQFPWTMHVKDPGFGILAPLLTLGAFGLVVGAMSLAILVVRIR